MKQGVRVAEILLVEDSPGDVRLAQEALKDGALPMRLHVVRDGVEAMAFLRRQGEYADAPRPDIILLDLNLPRKDGREVLAEIKADEDLRRIPVVILTVSSSEEDIRRSYNGHANCYITKPMNYQDFHHVVRAIQDFWYSVVSLPPDCAGSEMTA